MTSWVAVAPPITIHFKAPGVRLHKLITGVPAQVVNGPVHPLRILDQLIRRNLIIGNDRAKLDVINTMTQAKRYHFVNVVNIAHMKQKAYTNGCATFCRYQVVYAFQDFPLAIYTLTRLEFHFVAFVKAHVNKGKRLL
jgi:hypothetical protein